MNKRTKPCDTCHCTPCICHVDQRERAIRIMERALRIDGVDPRRSQAAAELACAHLEHNGYAITFTPEAQR